MSLNDKHDLIHFHSLCLYLYCLICIMCACVQIEELLGAMEKVKQELESMRAKLSSTQQSLCEKETHLTTLRAERRKHLEEVLEMK